MILDRHRETIKCTLFVIQCDFGADDTSGFIDGKSVQAIVLFTCLTANMTTTRLMMCSGWNCCHSEEGCAKQTKRVCLFYDAYIPTRKE